MKKLLLIFTCLILTSCSAKQANNTNTNQVKETAEQIERNNTINRFQTYVGSHYPQWKVKGYRHDDYDTSYGSVEKNYYSVLISDGKQDGEIVVAISDFIGADGTTVSHIYELSKDELDRRAIAKSKE